MNLKGRIQQITIQPLAGDEIDELKKAIRDFAKEYGAE